MRVESFLQLLGVAVIRVSLAIDADYEKDADMHFKAETRSLAVKIKTFVKGDHVYESGVQPGCILDCTRDPTNTHQPDAWKICLESEELFVGHLPDKLAKLLTSLEADITSNPEACLIDCASAMTKKVREMTTHDFGFVNSELLEESHLEQFCTLYLIGKKCIDTCTDSPAKENLMATFRPLNYICVEHHKELLTHLTCYRQSQIEIEKVCAKKCTKSNLPIKDLQYYQAMGRNLNEILEALDELCSRLECELECQEPIISSICQNDTSAAAYMKNFARESILPMEAIMRKSSTLRFWPDNCHRITQGLGDKSKQRRVHTQKKTMSDSNGKLSHQIQSSRPEVQPPSSSNSEPGRQDDQQTPGTMQESVGLPPASASPSFFTPISLLLCSLPLIIL